MFIIENDYKPMRHLEYQQLLYSKMMDCVRQNEQIVRELALNSNLSVQQRLEVRLKVVGYRTC